MERRPLARLSFALVSCCSLLFSLVLGCAWSAESNGARIKVTDDETPKENNDSQTFNLMNQLLSRS